VRLGRTDLRLGRTDLRLGRTDLRLGRTDLRLGRTTCVSDAPALRLERTCSASQTHRFAVHSTPNVCFGRTGARLDSTRCVRDAPYATHEFRRRVLRDE